MYRLGEGGEVAEANAWEGLVGVRCWGEGA